MRIDLDRWEEIFITITRNKTRSLLTAFGVFWGIFMLVALMGGGQGLQDMMSANFKGFATNSVFFGSNKTSEAYKGFRKGRYWDMEFNDVERIRQAVPEVEVITPNISRWGSTAIFGDKKSSCAVRGAGTEDSVTLPFTTMQKAYNFGKRIDLVCITVKPGVTVTSIADKIEQVIKKAHYIHPDDKQAVIMVNAEAMFSMIDNLFTGIKILAWMVGLGTLLAGAIGVSNIMMVTVKERTTEIGIRRAIGARPKDILNQILSESMVLTTFAGLMGISFGVLILQGLEIGTAASGTEAHFQISFWMAVGACILLMVLGMLAGLAPAYRAMAIKPIEAIRDE